MSYRPRLSTNVGRGLAVSSITITLVIAFSTASFSFASFSISFLSARFLARQPGRFRALASRLRSLLVGSEIERGNVAASLGVHALFVDAVEESQELVELGLRDRVELMVVAAGAAHRQAEEDGGRRLDAVDGVLDPPFFLDRACFGDRAIIAVESGGDLLGQRGCGQQVAGNLFGQETVERLVAVICGDDPVAPGPHDPGKVVLKSVGIGKAGAVEPFHRHALAVERRSQQPVDLLLRTPDARRPGTRRANRDRAAVRSGRG